MMNVKTDEASTLGREMYTLAEKLYPITRSITGNGVRQTLHKIKEILPDLAIHEVATGTQAFDWQVPKEWNINDAYVRDDSANRVIDWQKNNLHVVSYSIPIDRTMSLQ